MNEANLIREIQNILQPRLLAEIVLGQSLAPDDDEIFKLRETLERCKNESI